MSDQPRSSHSRSLPDRPSLRFLKLEARERLAAGEFATLHDAQLAIAREHGPPSWAALKQLIAAQPHPDGHALGQVDRSAHELSDDQAARQYEHQAAEKGLRQEAHHGSALTVTANT